MIFHLSKLWKAKFFILYDSYFWLGCGEFWNWSLLGVKGLSSLLSRSVPWSRSPFHQSVLASGCVNERGRLPTTRDWSIPGNGRLRAVTLHAFEESGIPESQGVPVYHGETREATDLTFIVAPVKSQAQGGINSPTNDGRSVANGVARRITPNMHARFYPYTTHHIGWSKR